MNRFIDALEKIREYSWPDCVLIFIVTFIITLVFIS